MIKVLKSDISHHWRISVFLDLFCAFIPTFETSKLIRRTLCFEDYGDAAIGKAEESDSGAIAMCRRLCQKFGLESESPMAEAILQLVRNLVWMFV